MDFQYHYSGPVDSEIGILFAGVYGLLIGGSLLVELIFFVMRAYGLYTIAKRRGLQQPWLVWIPVADSWMIGSFSDQYRYLMKDEIKNKRKLLLGFSVANAVLCAVTSVIMLVLYIQIFLSGREMSDGQIAAMMMGPVIAGAVIIAIVLVTKLVEYVLRQICMYDLYRSCDPGNATAYLILGILFSVLEPIFLIALRNRDDGMPPRRDAPENTI